MTTNYVVYKNQGCVNAFGASFCDTVFSATLAANTDTSLAVPLTSAMGAPTANSLNKFLAVISCSASGTGTFIALNAVAAVPGGAAFAASTSELIPNGYIAKVVKSTDVIHFFSTGTPSISVAFYAIQE